MSKFRYYVNYGKAEEKAKEWNTEVEPVHPVIKSSVGGLYGDAGIDLFVGYRVVIPPHEMVMVESFVGFAFEPGVAALLFPRSSDWFILGAGVIDTGYTGTIKAKIFNPLKVELVLEPGDSMGQVVLFQKAFVDTPDLVEVTKEQLNVMSERGDTGGIVSQFNI